MRYLPINLHIRGRKIVVVGGGEVALRKCRTLLEAGGNVTVISPSLTPPLMELAEKGEICHLSREYGPGDLEGAFLVFAATDKSSVNHAVALDAEHSCIMAEITDAPSHSSFTSPAVINRGELLLAVSTGGEIPSLSAFIREELEERYGPEYGELTKILGKVREKLLTEKGESQYNKQILRTLLGHELILCLKRGAYSEIDRILTDVCGPGFTLTALGIGEKDK
jgi:precorrin-2 dehydrogenase